MSPPLSPVPRVVHCSASFLTFFVSVFLSCIQICKIICETFIWTIFLATKQVRIHKFFEKTKKKNVNEKNTEAEADPVAEEQEKLAKEQDKLRKKVTKLMKKQKLQQVRMIVKEQDDLKPWGQDAHVKVFVLNFLSKCCCLLAASYVDPMYAY